MVSGSVGDRRVEVRVRFSDLVLWLGLRYKVSVTFSVRVQGYG